MSRPVKAISLITNLIKVAKQDKLGLLDPTETATLASDALSELERLSEKTSEYLKSKEEE